MAQSLQGLLRRGGRFQLPRVAPPGVRRVEIKFNRIDEQYPAKMGTSAVRGRTFDSRDHESSPPVALINQPFGEAPEHYLYVPFWQSLAHEMAATRRADSIPARA